ncbi:helix-turn-helix domain-containing protein [Bacillus sp. G1(2015b)]|uniref:helix-turn-helix domain-containing protein n=1 Tax=Bacillus sp. G1(2015b) TaxID=1706732 RepID=UPI00073859BF|nr:helix-turn-helix transcriptional regulator [Bacillus sp. G1(2015b)]KUF21993.1 hypothetical protein AMR95_14755 [Bacillus sp. G1(2015b)]
MTSIEMILKNAPYFREFLKSYRKQKGINARDLSRELGKGDSYISQIESGRIKSINEMGARQLLNVLGTDQEDIDKIVYFYFYKKPSRQTLEETYNNKQETKKENVSNSIEDDLSNNIAQLMDSVRPPSSEEHKERAADVMRKLERSSLIINTLTKADIETAESLATHIHKRVLSVAMPIIDKELEKIHQLFQVLNEAKNEIENMSITKEEEEHGESE